MPEFDFKTTHTVVHRSSSDWNSCVNMVQYFYSAATTNSKTGLSEIQTSTTKDCKGPQNEYAEERRIYKDLISKNNKRKF